MDKPVPTLSPAVSAIIVILITLMVGVINYFVWVHYD